MSTPNTAIRRAHAHSPARRTTATPDPTDVPARFRVALLAARVERSRFRNAGLRIGRSTTVHAVRFREAPDGTERAATACHTGHDRPDGDPAIRPVTDEPVNCGACLARPIALDHGQPYVPMSGQYALWTAADGVPELPSYPPTEA